jgi:crotonobetainyl-CoA:carnitine CoA-transferase CaiB-like acyl-CoA transferase
MPIAHRRRGATHIVSTPVNIEGLETAVRRDVPDLGEHTREILAEAGLSADEIEALRAKGVIGRA